MEKNLLSKKNLPEMVLNFKVFNLLPKRLERYRGVFEITLDHSQYTPDFRNVILELALATHDNVVLKDYFSREYYNYIDELGLPSKDLYQDVTGYYHRLYDTRIENFDINNPLFKQMLCYAKIPFAEWKSHFNNLYMQTFSDMIRALSTDYTKVTEPKDVYNQLNETFNALLFMIVGGHLDEDDLIALNDINPWISKLLVTNTNVLFSMKKAATNSANLNEVLSFASCVLSYLLLHVDEDNYGIFDDIILKELPQVKDLSMFLSFYPSDEKRSSIDSTIKKLVDKYQKPDLNTEKDKQYIYDNKPND